MLRLVAAVLAAGGLGLVLAGRRDQPRRRLQRWIDRPARADPTEDRRRWRTWRSALALTVPVAAVAGFGLQVGAVIGVAGAVGVTVVLGRERPVQVPADEAALVVELVAGCLEAGLALPFALDAAAAAADPSTAGACRDTAMALRRGDPPEVAWRGWLADPTLAPVAQSAARGVLTGASSAPDLRRCAARIRATRRVTVRRRVQQASVWLTAPLGLCFLPAFVCVAVVPTVIGLFPHLG